MARMSKHLRYAGPNGLTGRLLVEVWSDALIEIGRLAASWFLMVCYAGWEIEGHFISTTSFSSFLFPGPKYLWFCQSQKSPRGCSATYVLASCFKHVETFPMSSSHRGWPELQWNGSHHVPPASGVLHPCRVCVLRVVLLNSMPGGVVEALAFLLWPNGIILRSRVWQESRCFLHRVHIQATNGWKNWWWWWWFLQEEKRKRRQFVIDKRSFYVSTHIFPSVQTQLATRFRGCSRTRSSFSPFWITCSTTS